MRVGIRFQRDERDRSTRRRGPALVIRGTGLPGAAAEAARSAAPPRGGDHLAPGARAGRVRLRAVDRPDPDRARHLRGARGRDRLPRQHVLDVARERDAHRATGSRSSCASREREHGDWWSLHGWWIFAGTAAVSLLSKYVIRLGGRHIFNPSNFGLVLCFLVLGSEPRRAARLLVGPDVAVDGARARDHRRRRARDPRRGCTCS